MHRFLPLILGLSLAFSAQAASLSETSSLIDVTPPNTVPISTTAFDPVIEDLPLMRGLAPLPNEATLFVAPKQGRIATSRVQGIVDVDDVYKFYHRSLPQLGWKPVNMRLYRRNGEQLHIDAKADGKVTTVRFAVNPE